MKNTELINEIEKRLRDTLTGVPFIQIVNVEHLEGDFDLSILIRLPLGEKKILVIVNGFGEARIAREAAARLTKARLQDPDVYGVFAAIYVSELTAQILADEKHGFIDIAGNCLLSFGQVFIKTKGTENPNIRKRRLRSLYSPKAERVLRVLMTRPARYRSWKVKELASEAQVSLGQVSNIRTLLLNREWVKERTGGIALTRPEELLEEWAANYRFDRNVVRDFYSMKSVAEVEAELFEVCARMNINYAFTAFSGIARVAPHVIYPKATVYVVDGIDKLAKEMGLKEVPTGANVSLITPYDPVGVLYNPEPVVQNARVVSGVQCYLDARSMKGRGVEAADYYLDNYLRHSW